MKFKKIKPGMVIHCPKEEDARELFKKIGQDTGNCFWNEYAEKTCYKIRKMPDESFQVSYQSVDYFNSYDITEFSDLIEPDEPQMSAVEVLEWLNDHYGDGEYKKVFGVDLTSAEFLYEEERGLSAQEVVDKITAYEATKKAPKPVEVEWVDVCRIIQIQDNGFKKCVYKEELPDSNGYATSENILKKYISEHEGQYIAVIEGICRVKEDK